jgi:tetratricopeptide (TPR) repeat protein
MKSKTMITNYARHCTRLSIFFFCFLGANLTWAGSTAKTPVRVWEDSMTIPTSVEGLPDPNPPFDLFNTGPFFNYPYTLRHNLVDRREPRKWKTLNLENEYLKCTVLPDLGGHLYTCIDKRNGASMFYANPSIKFARIAYRGMWAALGVEFNFPVSHNWMTVSPIDYGTTRGDDGSASIWIGNIDRVYGMQWRVELKLRPGQASLEQHTTLYNRNDVRHRFYWWTNAGVQVWDDSQILYPMQFTAGHGFSDIDTWPVDSAGVDLSIVGNQKFGPVSRFSYGSRESYMAVYHPRTHSGVVHYSSPIDLPAKKIWSWSGDADGLDWRTALSDNNSAYVEIQAGLFRNQETYGFLDPEETISFTEYWIPIRDLGGLSRATPDVALNLTRPNGDDQIHDTTSLSVALNVTKEFPNASLNILNGEATAQSARVSLSPQKTFTRIFPALPADATYTVELRDQSGKLFLRHTEGRYDFTSKDEIKTGKQSPHVYPAEEDRSSDDFLAIGTEQELNGNVLAAHSTFLKGCERFPNSIALNRAAGRIEVVLKQYQAGAEHLAKVLSRVSNDAEAAYYRALALQALGRVREANILLESAQQFDQYHSPALFELAANQARVGNLDRSLQLLDKAGESHPNLLRLDEIQIALLRNLGRADEARKQLSTWQSEDPTSSFLRYERIRLGGKDQGLLAHLAADPERILAIASEYIRFGLYKDALDVLSRDYPTGPTVGTEPGISSPAAYPLIAYYRGYCREMLGADARADFDSASRMPTKYVFPNRPETFDVLKRALLVNPNDATAHFLLGSLYLSGGMQEPAVAEWELARHINPDIPTLHRNLGYLLLRSGGSPVQSIEVFREGMRYDSHNVDLYLGLEEAMQKAGSSLADRVQALESYPDRRSAPAAYVFHLVQILGDSGDFDRAEEELANRFFPREEGAVNVRQIYVELKLKRAQSLATRGQCDQARSVVMHLSDIDSRFAFTTKGMEPFVTSKAAQGTVDQVKKACAASRAQVHEE